MVDWNASVSLFNSGSVLNIVPSHPESFVQWTVYYDHILCVPACVCVQRLLLFKSIDICIVTSACQLVL